MSVTFGSLASRLRLSLFSRNRNTAPEPDNGPGPSSAQSAPAPKTGRTFPADEVVWGIAIRNGFDEIDDPWYHQGTTQHAYLEGSDAAAICGFRPPQSGPRTRRRSRLGLPTAGEHPLCGMCARMVVAPRPRVPIPIQPRQPVPVPVQPDAPVAVPVAAAQPVPVAAAPVPPADPMSPWVKARSGIEEPPNTIPVDMGGRHDSGLLERGVHAEIED